MSEFPKKPIKSLPVLAAILRRRTRVVGTSWSRDFAWADGECERLAVVSARTLQARTTPGRAWWPSATRREQSSVVLAYDKQDVVRSVCKGLPLHRHAIPP